MNKLLTLIFCLFSILSNAQSPIRPTALPSPKSNGYAEIGYYRHDSGLLSGQRDTAWRPPAALGAKTTWQNKYWKWDLDSLKWTLESNARVDTSLFATKQALTDTSAFLKTLIYARPDTLTNRYIKNGFDLQSGANFNISGLGVMGSIWTNNISPLNGTFANAIINMTSAGVGIVRSVNDANPALSVEQAAGGTIVQQWRTPATPQANMLSTGVLSSYGISYLADATKGSVRLSDSGVVITGRSYFKGVIITTKDSTTLLSSIGSNTLVTQDSITGRINRIPVSSISPVLDTTTRNTGLTNYGRSIYLSDSISRKRITDSAAAYTLQRVTTNGNTTTRGLAIWDSTTAANYALRMYYHWGDSWTFGVGATVPANRYTSRLDSYAGYIEVNRGTSGTTGQRITPGDSSFLDKARFFPIPADTNSRVTVLYGTNDTRGSSAIYKVDSFSKHMNWGFDTLITKGWRSYQIKVISVGYYKDPAQSIIDARVALYNDTLRAICARRGFLFIDIYSIEKPLGNAILSADTLHPNDAGYDTIFQVIRRATLIQSTPEFMYSNPYLYNAGTTRFQGPVLVNPIIQAPANAAYSGMDVKGQFNLTTAATGVRMYSARFFAPTVTGLNPTIGTYLAAKFTGRVEFDSSLAFLWSGDSWDNTGPRFQVIRPRASTLGLSFFLPSGDIVNRLAIRSELNGTTTTTANSRTGIYFYDTTRVGANTGTAGYDFFKVFQVIDMTGRTGITRTVHIADSTVGSPPNHRTLEITSGPSAEYSVYMNKGLRTDGNFVYPNAPAGGTGDSVLVKATNGTVGVVSASNMLYSYIQAVTATSTVTPTAGRPEVVYTVDATAGNVTLTISTTSLATGYQINVKRLDNSGNSVTVLFSSGTIDGAANITIPTQYQNRALIWNGTNAYLLN